MSKPAKTTKKKRGRPKGSKNKKSRADKGKSRKKLGSGAPKTAITVGMLKQLSVAELLKTQVKIDGLVKRKKNAEIDKLLREQKVAAKKIAELKKL
jgi:hypothetical protein